MEPAAAARKSHGPRNTRRPTRGLFTLSPSTTSHTSKGRRCADRQMYTLPDPGPNCRALVPYYPYNSHTSAPPPLFLPAQGPHRALSWQGPLGADTGLGVEVREGVSLSPQHIPSEVFPMVFQVGIRVGLGLGSWSQG
ncbi:unnamed protein product [Discosporangium mesarthrocarpum]